MSSLRQIEANRQNALKSTGPQTTEGKSRSRCNAVRHGLTAETVVGHLEDVEDYRAFEESVTSSYEPVSASERELVLRLASLLWRLRRANLIEIGLLATEVHKTSQISIQPEPGGPTGHEIQAQEWAQLFAAMLRLPNRPLDRLTRYEAALWRQTRQLLAILESKWGRPRQRRRGPI